MIKKAQEQFDFYETPKKHAYTIYDDCKAHHQLNVIDICCGLGSLVQPWYDNGHNVTLVELDDNFIPILKQNIQRQT